LPTYLAPAGFAAWLDPATPAEQLYALLRPYPAEALEVLPVGGYVSNPCNEGPDFLAS
jgi:putative SOS response-associated peptidase YedK